MHWHWLLRIEAVKFGRKQPQGSAIEPRLPLLTAREFRMIEPLLPSFKGHRPRVDDRRMISAILFSLGSGCPWRELPEAYGNRNTIRARYNRWRSDGTID